jgi:hypothetical protein
MPDPKSSRKVTEWILPPDTISSLNLDLARSEEQDFAEVVSMIQQARQRSLTAVNIALIELY